MTENDAAVYRRDPVGADAIEECMSIRPLYIELGEGRKVHEAHPLAHRQGFRLDRIPPIGAFERILLARAGRVVPTRPLPPEHLLELGASRLEPVMDRGGTKLAPDLVLLAGLVAVIHVVIVGD